MKHRRGISLAEMIVIMSISSVLLTLSTTLIHRMMRNQSQTRRFFDAQRSALRLSEQFRQDVHDASTAATADLPERVVVRFSGKDEQMIEYRREAWGILRSERQGETTSSREEYRFPDPINVAVRQEESPQLMVLQITPQPVKTMESPRPNLFSTPVHLQVEARLGKEATP